MHLIPRRRDGPFQMRIIRQNRLAARAQLARHHPGVRSRLELAPRARRIEKRHFGSIASIQHRHLAQLLAPRHGQGAIHLQPAQQTVHNAPGARIVTQQRKFERQRLAMRFDEVIHAACVGREYRPIGGRQRPRMILRNAPHAQATRFAIQFQRGRAQHFRQLAGRQTPQHIHLPQADPVPSRSLAGK